jgi:hypothetical protein
VSHIISFVRHDQARPYVVIVIDFIIPSLPKPKNTTTMING